jgi:S-DNA-T family DNA segregation ATPase FtsK/SpoIIIE
MSPTPAGATLDYNRPPRLLPPPRASDFTVPPIPRKPDKQSIPWAMVIAPVVMSGGMYAYTHSPLTLMFAGLTPIMALSNASTSRRTAKRNYRQQVEDFRTRKTRVEHDAYESLVSEREVRRHDFADPAALLVTATGPRVRLWERRPTDPDWLFARVGTADVPSDVTVREPAREAHEGPLLWTAPDVPVTVPLAEVGVTGIAGPDELRRAIGRWIVAQTAVLHSPAEIELVVFADQRTGLGLGSVATARASRRRCRAPRSRRYRRRECRRVDPRTAQHSAEPPGHRQA